MQSLSLENGDKRNRTLTGVAKELRKLYEDEKLGRQIGALESIHRQESLPRDERPTGLLEELEERWE